ncbi:MAG: ABC transporter permease subunit [Candidatus Sumerlaeia bacterium]|nr:ABC transporter permease subunit [Candidatus Sumerlaeia bacterium]
MSPSQEALLKEVRDKVSRPGKAPMWALVFESIVRGITWAVVLILIFILSTILLRGGPRVIGIHSDAKLTVVYQTDTMPLPDRPVHLMEGRSIMLDAANDDPARAPQSILTESRHARLGTERALVALHKGTSVVVRTWETAVVDGEAHENRGQNMVLTDFESIVIDGGRLTIMPYRVSVEATFLTDVPRRAMRDGGIFPALFGTVFVVLFMIMMALPIGVFAAVYMVEYARIGFLARIIRAAVNNLAGVPSIVFGLFGLGFFILFVGRNLDYYILDIPRSEREVIAYTERMEPLREQARSEAIIIVEEKGLVGPERGAFIQSYISEQVPEIRAKVFGQGAMIWAAATLAILVLPLIIVSTEEALRAVPASTREAAYGLGATKWQMIRTVVLPQARPGILTGAILAVARGAGELAPILFVGVTYFAPTLPLTEPINLGLFEIPMVNPFKEFMHLNYHIYTLATQHQDPEGTRAIQFATTLVLVAMTFLMNLAAIILRRRYTRN